MQSMRQLKKDRRTLKLADNRINRAYMAACTGIGINILDIPKVFAFGRLKVAAGEDDATLAASIRAYVDTLAKN